MLDIKTHASRSPKIKQATPVLIAQVTDTHLFASSSEELLGVPTNESLQAVIGRLFDLRNEIDLLLLTGDLSSDGKLKSYEILQNLLRPLNIPVYWLPGNHDCPETMQCVLNLGLFSRRKSFERGGWNFVLLNSRVTGCVHGLISAESLNWLDSQLTKFDRKPTAIALHHPLFEVNSRWLDRSALQNSEEFFAVVDRHPQVKLVLFGHIHQEFYCQRGSVHYLGTPSTCIQFQPQSSKFALDRQLPGFRLLKLYPDGEWESWVERVDYSYELDVAATGY